LHEINLPIATIDANIKMILKSLDSKNAIRANRIIGSTKRLKRLYNKLSYAIKKDIMPIEKEEFNLKDLIDELIDGYKEIFGDRFNLNLHNLYLKTDKTGLEQAIENVVINALKYSNKNIDITIKSNLLIIKDYGKGMDANELLKIYDRYYQGDKSYKGSGIGLSLVKEFCDKEKIEIKINSTPNIGTTVSFNFNNILA
jgi:signal transduction histidine kinase